MGSRNRAFVDENNDEYPSRNGREEISSISKTTFVDGAELTKYVKIISRLNIIKLTVYLCRLKDYRA